jgi:hypothetical protein
MKGMLADVNVQGHLNHLRHCLQAMDLWNMLDEVGIRFETLRDQGLASDLDDRSLWGFCQSNGWVLFTNDKNNNDANSLQATLDDSWYIGLLPVLTLSNQGRFVRDGFYTRRVANDLAGLLVDIKQEIWPLNRPRIFIPISRFLIYQISISFAV